MFYSIKKKKKKRKIKIIHASTGHSVAKPNL